MIETTESGNCMKLVMLLCCLVPVGIQPESCPAAELESILGNRTFFVLPATMYTTDTGFSAGIVGIKSYHSERPRNSSIQFATLVSTRKQVKVTAKIEHYFEKGNRLYGEIGYQKFPTDFFGIGNNTLNDDSEHYTPESANFECFYELRLYRSLNLRASFYLKNTAIIKSERGGMIDNGAVPFAGGRFDAGPGIGLVWDSRDNTLAATRGLFFALTYTSLFLQDTGGASTSATLDFRAFFNPVQELVSGTMVLLGDRRGDVPFYLLSSLGGQDRLRGYEDRRFIDRSMILVQQDIRFPVWRFIGGAVFGGVGEVAPELGEAFSGRFHAAYGIGARVFLNKEEHLVIRVDSAWGADTNGFYVTFGEAF